jgi:hypothetical protein
MRSIKTRAKRYEYTIRVELLILQLLFIKKNEGFGRFDDFFIL